MGRFNATRAVAAPQAQPQPQPVPASPGPHLTVLPPPAASPPPAAPAGKPKLDFGGLKQKPVAAVATSEYPILPDPEGQMAQWAEAFLEAHAQEEAATGAKESARFELVKAAAPFHFKVNAGKVEIPSSVSIMSPKGEVRVTFKDAYKKLDDAKFKLVTGIIGASLADTFLTQTFEIAIKSENIPEARMQDVIDGLRELATRLDIANAVTVSNCYKPTPAWHVARFRQLSAEQNLRLEAAVDREKGFCTMSVGPVRGKKSK